MVSTKNRWTPCRYLEESGRCVARTVTLVAGAAGGQAKTGAATAIDELLEGFAYLEAVWPVGLGQFAQNAQGLALGIDDHGISLHVRDAIDDALPTGTRL